MPNLDREILRNIKSFPQLVKYLRDELEWPIEQESFDDLTFDYEPEELGLDPKTAAKIDSIKQLRPLASNQPWGIFFIKFDPKSLPVVALRRILSHLVFKKRQSANKADRQAWNLHDLLFISNYGEGETRQITFAHFSDPPKTSSTDLPTLKVLGWDEADTLLHLDHTHQTLKEKLHWPHDTAFPDNWRKSWSEVFTLKNKEVINTTKELCLRMAHLATAIRKKVNSILAVESDKGPLKQLMKGFQQALIHDLKPDDFADMYAQTITYGMLSAAVSRTVPGEDTIIFAENLIEMVPNTNPFLRELLSTFLTVGGRKGKLDFDELGINDVVQALREANMAAVLRDFNDKNPAEDPVIHFYELFLKEYDAKKRMQRGVFYTPKPVVSYIVRSVHELLQSEFGLADGLADVATWRDMLKRLPHLKLPTIKVKKPHSPDHTDEPTDPTTPFVNILDPATGTATFLVEVIEIIHQTMLQKWQTAGRSAKEIQALWNDYVPDHLLPRLHGFELMMAPYAIAHMKIGLKLFETGYQFKSHERARIYLTNSLEPAQDFSDKLAFEAPALAHEAHAVNAVKRHQRFTVVIGNPPYAGTSMNISRRDDGSLTFIGKMIEDYKQIDGVALGERNPKFLQDDYVKFIRLAQFQIDTTGVGILGFITNHGYIDNPTFRGMRLSLKSTLHAIRIVDLHGSLRKKEESPDGSSDGNVFDIQQGVSILIGIKEAPGNRQQTVLHHHRWGTRESKYDWLLCQKLKTADWTEVLPTPPKYLLCPVNSDLEAETQSFVALNDLMPVNVIGFQTHRDDFAIDFDEDSVVNRFREFRSTRLSDDEFMKKFNVSDNRDWSVAGARKAIRDDPDWEKNIIQFLYRPFDIRWCYFSTIAMDYPRRELLDHVANRKNLCLLAIRQMADTIPYSHFLCSRFPAIDRNFACSRGAASIFPLFLYNQHHQSQFGFTGTRQPNMSLPLLEEIAAAMGIHANTDGLPVGLAPENVFHYAYAIFHSPTYRARYADLMKSEFPRLPRTGDLKFFKELVAIGSELVTLHLLEAPKCDGPGAEFIGNRNIEVEKILWSNDTIYLDKAQTTGFTNVPEDVWNFHIGGYQVCEKWLKDRKDRTLSKDDIAHYHKIIAALAHTIRLMQQIDQTIHQHGGWPNAFLTTPTPKGSPNPKT